MSYSGHQLKLTTFDPVKDLQSWHKPPEEVFRTRRIDNVLYCAGVGNSVNPDIMFIAPTLFEEEAMQGFVTKLGTEVKDEAAFLKGPSGKILRDICLQAGIDLDKEFYTSFCKWLLPRDSRTKLKKAHFDWGRPALLAEIRRLKPKIIVCLGKPVFDQFSKLKISLSEIEGGFFDYTDPEDPEYQAVLFPMDSPYKLVTSPDTVERMFHNLREVAWTRDQIRGFGQKRRPVRTRVVDTLQDLRKLVDDIITSNPDKIAFDCEWAGKNHIDGKLRSTQLAWTAEDAAYIRFCKAAPAHYQEMPYTFNAPYKMAGMELRRLVNAFPGRKVMVGHQASADMPWWLHVLGVDLYRKIGFDTLYGQQVADEALDVKLERLAVMYAGLGRYDVPLQIWKKKNKLPKDAGYGAVPDDVIIPYGCFDVLATWRSVDPIKKRILAQGLRLWRYWQDECLPFVTDIFTNFTVEGLSMDRAAMDETRSFMVWARDNMEREFKESILEEAKQILRNFLETECSMTKTEADNLATSAEAQHSSGNTGQGWMALKEVCAEDRIEKLKPIWEHRCVAPNFNLRSGEHMRRWLFSVKGFVPLKTTGKPAIDWQKVMSWPEERRKDITPAADKAVLQVYASDPIISQLLELNLTGNLVKAFLKPSDMDPETGELVKENGLHSWVTDDGKIHGMFSLTETARPRSWNPNSLNWPSYVNDRILDGVQRLCRRYKAEDDANPNRDLPGFVAKLPPVFARYVDEKPRSVRSLVVAGSNNIFVETDFKTAEIYALAYKSGDKNLLRILTEADKQFVLALDKNGKKVPVRVWYDPEYDIRPENQHEVLLNRICGSPENIVKWRKEKGDGGKFTHAHAQEEMKSWVDSYAPTHLATTGRHLLFCGKQGASYCVVEAYDVKEGDWVLNADGSNARPGHDLHWALAESVYGMPREMMIKKLARDGTGKVGNFSSAYGATPASLERKIKVDTGVAPPEGTGEGIIAALWRKYPVSQQWLKDQEDVPATGSTQAYSGRIRHFHTGRKDHISFKQADEILSPLKREARNFHMQHMVASIAARAAIKLVEHFRVKNMKAKVVALLYDSIVTECPMEERHVVAELHQRYMSDETWEVHHEEKRSLLIDVEFNHGWSLRPSDALQAKYADRKWNVCSFDRSADLLSLHVA